MLGPYLILEAVSDIVCLGVGNSFAQGIHVEDDHFEGRRYFEAQANLDVSVFSDFALSVDLPPGHHLPTELIHG